MTVISTESAVVTEPLAGGRDPAAERRVLDPRDERAVQPPARRLAGGVLARTRSADRNQVLTVRVRAKDTRGFVIRDALVFVRSTPRVTTGGDRQVTTTDGWVTYQLAPNGNFPKPRRGLQRAVLREGVPLGRPRPGRHRRLPARAGAASRLSVCVGGPADARSPTATARRGVARAPPSAGRLALERARGARRSGPSRRPGRARRSPRGRGSARGARARPRRAPTSLSCR